MSAIVGMALGGLVALGLVFMNLPGGWFLGIPIVAGGLIGLMGGDRGLMFLLRAIGGRG